MIRHFTTLLTGPYGRKALLLLLVLLLHSGVIAAVFWPVTPVPDAIEPPSLQGVLVQNVAVQEQLPQEIVTEPPPEPPKQETPPLPQEKPPVTAPVTENAAPAPPVEPRRERPAPAPVQQHSSPPPEPPPVRQKPAAAPVRMPDAHAAHLQNPAPVYPVLSRKRREQGTVILRLLVLADGRVADISIYQSSGYPRLDDSAVQAVKRWRYTPAVQEGKAIDYWHLQPVVFSIN